MKELIGELLKKNFKLSPDKDELFEKLRFGDLLSLTLLSSFVNILPTNKSY
jgi:hypothetical protein